MLCSEYTLISSLLSTALFVSNSYNGTDIVYDTPAAYFDDINGPGYGLLNITLPRELGLSSFLWNETYADGTLVYDENGSVPELNITLQQHAFRLILDGHLPSSIEFEVMWENVTLHSAIVPLNVTNGTGLQPLPSSLTNDGVYSSWYLDFTINDTLGDIQDDLIILIPYQWEFSYRYPSFYTHPIDVSLIPFDWSYKEQSSVDSYLSELYNITNASLADLSSLYGAPRPTDLSLLTLSDSCIPDLANETYGVIQSYEGLLNCSKCIHPNQQMAIHASTMMSIIQIGADLACESAMSSAKVKHFAGDTFNFTFSISHNPWSAENATQLQVRLDTHSHAEIISLSVTKPSDNGTSMTDSVQPADGEVWTIDVADYLLDHPTIVFSGSVKLRDSLPLPNKIFEIDFEYSWTSDSADGDVFSGICHESYRSESVTVDVGGSYMTIPADGWGVGEPAEVMVNFEVPPGTVNRVSLKLDFEYDTALVDVELIESLIVTSSDLVSVSEPLRVSYTDAERKRRAVSTTSHIINVGTVVNPSASGTPATISISTSFRPALGSSSSVSVAANAVLRYAGQTTPIASANSTLQSPTLTITKVTKYGSTARKSVMVNITVEHLPNSTGSAHDLTILNAEKGFKIDSSTLRWFPASLANPTFTSKGEMKIVIPEYNTSAEAVVVTFQAELSDDEFPGGTTKNFAKLSYNSFSNPSASVPYAEMEDVSCTERNDVESEVFLYKHGITAAAVIIGFILGLVLIPLIIFLIVIILKKTKGGFGASVRPSATDYRSISKQKRNNALLLDAGQKLKHGFNSAMAAVDDSIVSLLALRDRFTTNRELDNLDIQSTVEVDKRMEAERLHAMDDALGSLLQGMVKNGDITKQQFDVTMVQFRKQTKELDVKIVAEYTMAIEAFTKSQAMHNRNKLGGLLDKQRADKTAQLEKVSDMSDADRQELVKHIDTQCQIEQDDLSYRLKLEQDEEAEKIRKEFALRKRIQTKELQQTTLKELQAKAEMPEEMASWLMKEHAQNVAHLEKIHDDELCRQKLVLEEKLAKRRMLAELSDVQEKSQSELLNTIAGGQMDILKKAKKQKILTAEEARTMSDEIMSDLMTYKQTMEQDMAKQEAALHGKLSELKKKKIAAKSKEQEKELADFEKRCKAQQQQSVSGTLSPLTIAEERLQLIAKAEIDMASTEIQIDQENAAELSELRKTMSQTYKGRLMEREKKLLGDLKSDGLRDEQVESILADHMSDVETLEARQAQQYQQQDESLRMKLKKRRRDWEKRMQQEQEEKAQLREQEATVVKQIIDSQFTMSVEEREKIMREHETNMIRLENSLTLNKLRQRQILEQKLADRRAKRMQELEHQQLVTAKKTEKRYSNEDEDEQQMATIEMLKSQAEERVAVLTDEDAETNFDDELEKVKLEILQQRAVALREQEDRLGSMVAQLQINKAKELTEIDEKQRAINELKANLIDDLSDRGVMSDIEAEQCLEQHRAQQEKLTRKLNTEREKQEKILKKKLADRLQTREKTLLDGYEDRLRDAIDSAPNKIAARLKKAALVHKRNVAVEEFKAHMEKEISQSLEDMKREHNIKKAKLVQELELRFIASLVKQGKLKRSDLKDCLKMLIPAKTDLQLEQLINTLYDEKETVVEDEQELLNSSSASMLRQRIARSVSLYQNGNLGPIEEESYAKPHSRPRSSRKSLQPSPLDLDYAPETIGRQKLPPLKPLSSKKRRPQPNSEDY